MDAKIGSVPVRCVVASLEFPASSAMCTGVGGSRSDFNKVIVILWMDAKSISHHRSETLVSVDSLANTNKQCIHPQYESCNPVDPRQATVASHQPCGFWFLKAGSLGCLLLANGSACNVQFLWPFKLGWPCKKAINTWYGVFFGPLSCK